MKGKSVAGPQPVAVKTSSGTLVRVVETLPKAHSQYPRRGGEIPTTALVIPMPFCKPSYTGSTLAQASAIPTAASVAFIEYSLLWLCSRGQDFGRSRRYPHRHPPCLDCAIASRGSASDIDAPHVGVITLMFMLLGSFSAELYVVGGESHFHIFPFKILFYSRSNAHASNLQSHFVRRMPSCRCTWTIV
jgi:hypothetical protein